MVFFSAYLPSSLAQWAEILFFSFIGVVVGIIALFLEKIIYVAASSIFGTFCIISAIDAMLGGEFSELCVNTLKNHTEIDTNWVTYLEFGLLFAGSCLGIFIQYRFTSKDYKYENKPEYDYSKLEQDLFYN